MNRIFLSIIIIIVIVKLPWSMLYFTGAFLLSAPNALHNQMCAGQPVIFFI